MRHQVLGKKKHFALTVCDVSLDARSGNLVGVRWKKPALDVISEPRLGANFRILLPKPGLEANYFHSGEQRVARIEPIPDGVACMYVGLRNEIEKVEVDVRYEIRAVEDRLEFSIEVRNGTDRPLAEVHFGMVGGLSGVGNRLDTQSMVPGADTNHAPALFQKFGGGGGGGIQLGIRHAVHTYAYPATGMVMPWVDFFNRKKDLAIYYGDHTVETRLSLIHIELRPYSEFAALDDDWPTPEELPPGEPIGLTLAWNKMPYQRRGTFRAGPVVLQVHRGDWREATRIHRKWFDQHFDVRRPASWLRKEHAWQSIIMSNPEGTIVHRFKDLPRLAADAKKYGVTTFEILGWDVGGIDRGYPDYTPDPRLGTKKEFEEALRAIKKIGVHPVIFANVQFADTATPEFKREYHRYAVHGRCAPDLKLYGWGEGTYTGRVNLAVSNMTVISPAYPAFRKLLIKHFVALAKAGADGLQLDKTCVQVMLDFNPNLPTSPDRSLTHEVYEALREIMEACRRENPEFALGSEIWNDRSLPYVDVSYMRMWSIDMNCPIMRYAFPEWTSTTFAENPGDYNVVNDGMRYGLVWAMACRHYNESLDDPLTRPLARYLREMIRIRKRHEEVLFLGRFFDTEGATVRGGGKNVRHSVFETMDGRRKACVVVNFSSVPVSVTVAWPGGKGKTVEVCQPFQRDRRTKLPAKLTLMPQTCAVVVEITQKE